MRNNSCCLRVPFSTLLGGERGGEEEGEKERGLREVLCVPALRRGDVQDHDGWSISRQGLLVCAVCVGPLSSANVQKAVIQSNLEERVWQQPSLIDNSRPRVWNVHTRCKKKPPAKLKTSWNAFVIVMWCESVWQDCWRDTTLKGPVKEWQRSRADVMRQETITRAVMPPK